MNATHYALAFAAMLACAAGAQTPTDADADRPDTPWTGQVTGDNVNVRSSPRETGSYVCMRLSSPAKVTVVGATDGWLEIEPPAGAFSIISSHEDLVRRDPDRKTGTVLASNVRVRAGTRIHDWSELRRHWDVQTHLDRGDKILILGRQGDFYRIKPPEGVHFYITRQYVERVAGDEAATADETMLADGDAADVDADGADAGAGDDGGPDADAATGDAEQDASVVSEAKLDDIKAALEAFNELERQLRAEFAKPADQRDLRKLLLAYRGLEPGKGDFLQPYIDSRIQFLNIAIRRRAERREAEELIRIARQTQQEFESARAKIEVTPPTRPAPVYAARGVLVPSALYRGGGGEPKRYVVRDPDTLAIRAYAQCREGTVAFDRYVGKEVGLIGRKRSVAGLDADVIEVSAVIALSEDVKLAAPPEPTVGLYTPPAPEEGPGPLPRPIRPGDETPEEPPAEPEPVETKPANIEPAEIEPAEVEPADAEPVDVEPADAEPEPDEAEPADEAVPEPADEDFAPIRPERPDMEPGDDQSAEPEGDAADETAPDTGDDETAEGDGETAEGDDEKPEPLPPTGLPVGVPTTQPEDDGINEEEFK